MQAHLTHLSTLFKHYHASVNLDIVDAFYLEVENVYRPVLKNKTATVFFLKEIFLVFSN